MFNVNAFHRATRKGSHGAGNRDPGLNSPWRKSRLHSSGDASRLTALFVGYICPICALLPSTLVAPLATRLVDDAEPLRIRVPAVENLQRDSDALIDQLRAIDSRRLVRGPLTRLGRREMAQVGQALLEVLDLA